MPALLEAEISVVNEKRTYAPAKIEVKALMLAKKAAMLKEMTLADYVSELIMEYAPGDVERESAKITKPRRPGK